MSDFSFYVPETTPGESTGTQTPSTNQPDGGNTTSANQQNNSPVNSTPASTQNGANTQSNQQDDQQQENESNKTVQEGMLVCNGALCQCTFGTAPIQLIVTSNAKYYVNDPQGAQKMVATMKDNKIANLNFGICKNGSSPPPPCAANLTWTQEHSTVKLKIQGAEVSALSENSRATCAIGGQVSILKNGQVPQVTPGNVDKISVAAPAVNCLVNMQEVKELTRPKPLRPVSIKTIKAKTDPALENRSAQSKSKTAGEIKVRLNEELTFEIDTYYSPATPTEEEKRQIDWSVFIGGKLTNTYNNHGAILKMKFTDYGTYQIEASGKEKVIKEDGTAYNDKGASIDVEVIKNEIVGITALGTNQRKTTKEGFDYCVRKKAPITFKADFLIEPIEVELNDLKWIIKLKDGNEVDSKAAVPEITTSNIAEIAAYEVIIIRLSDNAEIKKIVVTSESSTVSAIKGTVNGIERNVIRQEEAIAFKVISGSYGSEFSQDEAADIKWKHFKENTDTNEIFPNGTTVAENKYSLGNHVVEAYVKISNGYLKKSTRESDEWAFSVEYNSISNIRGEFNPKLGKFYSYSLDYIMPLNSAEIPIIVWEITGPENHNYSGKQTLTIRFNQKGTYKIAAYIKGQSRAKFIKDVNVVQPEITDAYWTDADLNIITKSGYGKLDSKGEKVITGQEVYMHIKHVGLEGESIKIQVWDDDSTGNNLIHDSGEFTLPSNPTGEFKFQLVFSTEMKKKIEEHGIYKYGDLYFKVICPHLTVINSDKVFPTSQSKYLYVTADEKIVNAYFADTDDRKKILRADYTDKVNIQIYSANLVDREVEVFLVDYKKASAWWGLLNPILLNEQLRDYMKEDKLLLQKKVTIDKQGQAKLDIGMSNFKSSHEGAANNVRQFYAAIKYGDKAFMVQSMLNVTMELASSIKSKEGVGCVTVEVLEKKSDTKICDTLVWGSKVSCEFRKKVMSIAESLKIGKDKVEGANWLMTVMALETGGTFDPSIVNSLGYTGLIQFGKSAAEDLGTTTYDLKKMNAINQLDYVKKYLGKERFKGKLGTITDTYLAVLYPAACGHGAEKDYIVFDSDSETTSKRKGYYQNPGFHTEEDEITKNSKGKIIARNGKKGGKTYVWEIENAIQGWYLRGQGSNTNDCSKNCTLSDQNNSEEDYSMYVQFQSGLEEDRRKLLSNKSIQILGKAAKDSGHSKISVASTIRYPRNQASAMYNNLQNGNDMEYKEPGQMVIAVYNDCIKNSLGKETTINKMVDKINSLSAEGKRVSLHCVSVDEYNKLNVVDISYIGLQVESFINKLSEDNKVIKILHDTSSIKNTNKITYLKKETCVHVEIKQ